MANKRNIRRAKKKAAVEVEEFLYGTEPKYDEKLWAERRGEDLVRGDSRETLDKRMLSGHEED